MQERQEHDSSDYLEVPIDDLRRVNRDIPFDLYLKLSENNYAHVFSKSTGLDYKRLVSYVQKGVKSLFIKATDQEAYNQFILSKLDDVLQNDTFSVEKKITALVNMTEQNMAELFNHLNVPEETAEATKKVIRSYVSLMTENPKTLTLILKLVSHGEYLYYHSIAVAVFSMYIARATGQFNKRMVELIGLGGFLHDVGCTQLPKEILDSPRELTPQEWKIMRAHTKMGLSMIESTTNIPDEVRFIVYQHHEEPSGAGYPNGLKANVIFYPAKIVALADAFSALISKRPFRPAFTLDQAIQILQTEKGKYDPNLVSLVTSVFQRTVAKDKVAA